MSSEQQRSEPASFRGQTEAARGNADSRVPDFYRVDPISCDPSRFASVLISSLRRQSRRPLRPFWTTAERVRYVYDACRSCDLEKKENRLIPKGRARTCPKKSTWDNLASRLSGRGCVRRIGHTAHGQLRRDPSAPGGLRIRWAVRPSPTALTKPGTALEGGPLLVKNKARLLRIRPTLTVLTCHEQ